MKLLVTGAAGFIGYHLSQHLLSLGHDVVGLDNLNEYYDVQLKHRRLERLSSNSKFRFEKIDVADRSAIEGLFKTENFQRVVHLAAQAGVRYSITNPYAYVDSNLIGFLNILEGCRHHGVEHLIYASTSSVYGLNTDMPFSPTVAADHPVSFYGATKKANEMMAHSYSHMYGLPTTGLRFFTVYGPWGRPDMALFLFTERILKGEPIDVFNHGKHTRDFTYISDIVDGVTKVSLGKIPAADPQWKSGAAANATSSAPYRIYNIGNSKPEPLMKYIETLEKNLGRTAIKNYLPLQRGDVEATHADISDLARDHDYQPTTSIEKGIKLFVDWYLEYYTLSLKGQLSTDSSSAAR